jgi:hypothetical protein
VRANPTTPLVDDAHGQEAIMSPNSNQDEFFGNLYHLNAEEEPENPDYPKNPGSASASARVG